MYALIVNMYALIVNIYALIVNMWFADLQNKQTTLNSDPQ